MQARGYGGRVVVVCGRGNNAGDGFVVARHLANAGAQPQLVLAAGEAFTPDAAANFEICRRMELPVLRIGEADIEKAIGAGDVLVDALLGTGARGALRSPFDKLAIEINQSAAPVVALDVPSGLDCETGEAGRPCVEAALTCTFVAPKVGFAAAGAARFLGDVEVIDIGAPWQAIVEAAEEAS